MKGRDVVVAVLLIFAVVASACVGSPGQSGTPTNTPATNAPPRTTIHHVTPNVTVEIPPSLELYGIVYYLAVGNDTFVTDRGAYARDVESWFGPFRNQSAVLILRKWLKDAGPRVKGHTNIVVEYFIRNYPDPEEINVSEILNTSTAQTLPPRDREFLAEFLPALRDFARVTNFSAFYRSHIDTYWEDLSIYAGALEKLPPDKFMEKYAGVSGIRYLFVHPYFVIVHGHNLIEEDNGTTVWGAGGNLPLIRRFPQRTLWSYKTAKDDFMELPLNRDYIDNPGLDELLYLNFIYHELGHDIINPVLRERLLELGQMEYFIWAIREDMPYLTRYDGHFSSVNMFYESFADAWADFALSQVDPDYALLAINMQKAWGEFWIGFQYNLTRKYVELARKEGKPFAEYAPEILEELRKFASSDNVSRVYEMNVPVTPLRAFDRASVTRKLLVIYGTGGAGEENAAIKSTAERVAKILGEFYGKEFIGTEIVLKADVDVTQEDLKENVVLVGNPRVNSIARELQEKFPLRFVELENGSLALERSPGWSVDSFVLTADKNDPVVRGRLNDTSSVALLLAVRNPVNPENYVVWIAGTNANLTALFENPTYYLSSYEIWSKKGIELGFYVQPLQSS
ncbi:DUF4932 domain-containing protein [Thermococcus nautili]|uniref:S-layer protein C-terminal domain-containing protein n=1 Tax=Thermococcus nautili TaxID=195522 RepID=W8PJX1_9EURY|nr:DUF4932 domain-containing protein [Thermococcus nautili]AHL22394.1 hypothetical protein BD01_0772 [Thermococcus nautili]